MARATHPHTHTGTHTLTQKGGDIRIIIICLPARLPAVSTADMSAGKLKNCIEYNVNRVICQWQMVAFPANNNSGAKSETA